ncbi:hypothetical protein SKAU_G00127970 [Synaphobranchus kaupii]|uniref:Uncharacterized protein n=1 Tax=Synaphobranchus kaupii TaxID=118154 RepID=A0A9Q1J2Q2_SYNKA|nr:hypothetical protein SKAU_G00127970 [Synaphobranchus kaupii]
MDRGRGARGSLPEPRADEEQPLGGKGQVRHPLTERPPSEQHCPSPSTDTVLHPHRRTAPPLLSLRMYIIRPRHETTPRRITPTHNHCIAIARVGKRDSFYDVHTSIYADHSFILDSTLLLSLLLAHFKIYSGDSTLPVMGVCFPAARCT